MKVTEDNQPDARRINACVNACAGLTTENLENILLLGETLLCRFNELQADNERLVSELLTKNIKI